MTRNSSIPGYRSAPSRREQQRDAFRTEMALALGVHNESLETISHDTALALGLGAESFSAKREVFIREAHKELRAAGREMASMASLVASAGGDEHRRAFDAAINRAVLTAAGVPAGCGCEEN